MSNFSSLTPTALPPERSMFVRVLCGFLWFIPLYFLVFIITGFVAGVISAGDLPQEAAATMRETYDQGSQVGRQAAHDIIRAHGGKLTLLAVGITILLSYKGFLPGTARFKRMRS